eukprot:210568_1
MSTFVLIIFPILLKSSNILCDRDWQCDNQEFHCTNNQDCTIICSAVSACYDSTFICPSSSNNKCNIKCDSTQSTGACQKTIINGTNSLLSVIITGYEYQFSEGIIDCGMSKQCNIQCGNDAINNNNMCSNSIINASKSSNLNIISYGMNSLQYSNIICPNKGNCNITIIGNKGELLSNSKIYIYNQIQTNLCNYCIMALCLTNLYLCALSIPPVPPFIEISIDSTFVESTNAISTTSDNTWNLNYCIQIDKSSTVSPLTVYAEDATTSYLYVEFSQINQFTRYYDDKIEPAVNYLNGRSVECTEYVKYTVSGLSEYVSTTSDNIYNECKGLMNDNTKPFSVVDKICSFCFESSELKEKSCLSLTDTGRVEWFLDRKNCFMKYCKLNCGFDQVEFVDGITVDNVEESCNEGCDLFVCSIIYNHGAGKSFRTYFMLFLVLVQLVNHFRLTLSALVNLILHFLSSLVNLILHFLSSLVNLILH